MGRMGGMGEEKQLFVNEANKVRLAALVFARILFFSAGFSGMIPDRKSTRLNSSHT